MQASMKQLSMLLLLAFCAGLLPVRAQTADSTAVIRLDPAVDELIAPDAKLELLGDEFGVTDGPNWVKNPSPGYLVFSDLAANVIYKMTPDGRFSVIEDRAGYTGYDIWNAGREETNGKDPNDPLFRRYFLLGADGLTLDQQGRIIVAGFIGRYLYRIEKNGKRTILADHYDGKRLGGPNDVIVKRDGAIFFSDTRGGTRGRGHDPKEPLLPESIYRIKDGKLTVAISDIPTPNGLAFSPDERYFYANNTMAKTIRRYDVLADDTFVNGRPFIDMNSDTSPGAPDGMRVDSKGNIYSSGPQGVWIISPEGKHLGTIVVPKETYVGNVGFGDADFKTLYIASRSRLYKIRLKTAGNRVF
jgi:gluconolactonase